jgi:hypothetical protein
MHRTFTCYDGIRMLTLFLKGNIRDLLDIEASEGGPEDGETRDSNNDGMLLRQFFIL